MKRKEKICFLEKTSTVCKRRHPGKKGTNSPQKEHEAIE